MRRNLVLIAALLVVGAVAFGQQAATEDAYAKSVAIGKVYTHPLGYRILYLRSTMDWGEMYVPVSWFGWKTGSKAEVVWGNEANYPYFTIYWVNGKFDHVRLYLRSNPEDISWGIMDQGLDLSRQFNVQEPPKDF
jgi:hypothetical protein